MHAQARLQRRCLHAVIVGCDPCCQGQPLRRGTRLQGSIGDQDLQPCWQTLCACTQTVDMGPGGPVRCGQCGAYINPYMQFSNDGRTFTCNLCKARRAAPAPQTCCDAGLLQKSRPEDRRRTTPHRPVLTLAPCASFRPTRAGQLCVLQQPNARTCRTQCTGQQAKHRTMHARARTCAPSVPPAAAGAAELLRVPQQPHAARVR